ncbi:MAG: glycosyltransferase family 9 protein [Pseudomonadota bacterium]
MESPPTSICLLRLSALGDVSHTVALLRALQRQWPQASITWVIGKLEYQLVKNIADVEFVVFDKSQGWGANRAVWRELKGRRFDVFLLAQAALRASVLSLGISARLRVGFDFRRARDFQWVFTNTKIASTKNQHVLDGLLEFAVAIGVESPDVQWDIPITDEDRAFAAESLGDTPTLVINACTSVRARNFRNWRADRYAAVADYAHKSYGLQIALTGGPNNIETEMASAIEQKTGAPVLNLVGKTSVAQLYAILAQSRLTIAPDTGPLHLANAAGVPVIGLYASSNPSRTGPYNARQWVVNEYPQALKKFMGKSVEQVRWGRRVRDPEALELIGFDQVIAMLDRVMRETTDPLDATDPA